MQAARDRFSLPRDEDQVPDTVDSRVAFPVEQPIDGLLRAKQILDQTFNRDLPIAFFAKVAHMTPHTFCRSFRGRFGLAPARYRLEFRLHRAAEMSVLHPEMSLPEIATWTGFRTVSEFYLEFERFFRVRPESLRSLQNAAPSAEPAPVRRKDWDDETLPDYAL